MAHASDIEAPTPPPNAEAIVARFGGTWMVEGTVTDGTRQMAVSGLWEYSPAADGWAVIGELATTIEGMGSFAESELIGVDSIDGDIHLFSMNRWTIRDHIGEWHDDATLVTKYASSHGAGAVSEAITIAFDGEERMYADVVETVDDEVVLTTRLVLRRRDG